MEDLKTRFPDDWTTRSASTPPWRSPRESPRIVHTLFEALALVIIVVFIFLQGWRATLIPLLAGPVSLVGRSASFRALAASPSNTLSLFGRVLAIGLVRTTRYRSSSSRWSTTTWHRDGPKDGALKGGEEVSPSGHPPSRSSCSAVFVRPPHSRGITGAVPAVRSWTNRRLGHPLGVKTDPLLEAGGEETRGVVLFGVCAGGGVGLVPPPRGAPLS